jgi:hypothetical protein
VQVSRIRRKYGEVLGDFANSGRLRRVLNGEKAERVSYAILVIGSLLDHVSSRLALMSPHMFEANPFSRWLQANGLWILFDVSILVLLTFPFSIVIRCTSLKYRRIILLTPLIVGLARLVVGVWNLMQVA